MERNRLRPAPTLPLLALLITLCAVSASDADAETETGYVKSAWSSEEITPSMGHVRMRKEGQGATWGAVYWQYFEQLDEVTSARTALAIEKRLFLRTLTDGGLALQPIKTNATLRPGDRLVVRLVLRTDRDLEYVHPKDLRASGLAPEISGRSQLLRVNARRGHPFLFRGYARMKAQT